MERSQTILQIANTSLRKAVLEEVDWLPEELEEWLLEKRGVFTTLYNHSKGMEHLRGCVGIPYPTEILGHAIAISAKRSALEDPRFSRVTPQELSSLSVSVEILGPMSKMEWSNYQELFDQFDLGIHGLLIKYNEYGGILLPRVPILHQMTKEEYVKAVCRKAFLPESILEEPEVELFRFTSEYFKTG